MSAAALVAGAAAALAAFLLRGMALRRAERDRRRLADAPLLAALVGRPGPAWSWARATLLAGGAGLLGFTAFGAATADADERPAGEGERETVLVLDASNSMLARDVSPSRLERERRVALELVGRLPGRIGVVYFAGGGYVLSPLTADMGAVRLFVDAVRPASVGRGGSALAAGIEQALDVLAGGREGARQAVVLLSDGEETVDRPFDDVLERAGEAGVPIHVVGIGSTGGARIPLDGDAALDPMERMEDRGTGGYLRGPDGRTVVTRLEEATLRRLAEETGGRYVRGSDLEPGELAARLARADPPPAERPEGGTVPLLMVALGLLWAEGFLLRRS